MQGYWNLVVSNNDDISTSMEWGYEITNGQESTETIGTSVTTSVEAGFEFEGFSAKVSVSTTFSHEIANTVSQTMSKSTTRSIQVNCDSNNGE